MVLKAKIVSLQLQIHKAIEDGCSWLQSDVQDHPDLGPEAAVQSALRS